MCVLTCILLTYADGERPKTTMTSLISAMLPSRKKRLLLLRDKKKNMTPKLMRNLSVSMQK